MKNALLAPNFPTSQISVCAATDAGATVVFRKEAAELIVQDTHFKLLRLRQLYSLKTDAVIYAHTVKSLSEWHPTLGHMNYDDILRLQYDRYTTASTYMHCMLGEQINKEAEVTR